MLEKPIIDTSVLPRQPFRLEIQHRELLKPVLPIRLRARTDVLKIDTTNDVLIGKVEKHDLSFPIMTRQYGIKPRFVVNLEKLIPEIAPDISTILETEMAQSRLRTAGEVARQEENMERELRGRTPVADLPSTPKGIHASPSPTTAIDPGAHKQVQFETQQASRQIDDALAQARHEVPNMPAMTGGRFVESPGIGLGSGSGNASGIPFHQAETPRIRDQSPHPVSIPQALDRNIAGAEQQLKAELSNRQNPSTTDMNAQLAHAEKVSQDTVKSAQPVMDMILTSLRKAPSSSVSAKANTAPVIDDDITSTIQWDSWHARFAKLAQDPLLSSVKKSGNASGSDTIEVTVLANHHLTVRLIKAGNNAFDKAMVQAYKSLDRSPTLAFPSGSRRTSVTFLIDNEHKGAGAPSGVSSRTSVDDKELIHNPRRPN